MLAQSRYGKKEYLSAANHGYQFLIDRMWDKEFGGFYWEVDPIGKYATVPFKHLYGQAFALYAISGYSRASEDKSSTTLAQQLFELIEHYSHDATHGGYFESFQRNWMPSRSSLTDPLGIDANIKTMNTHLHLAEAITSYFLLTKDQIARERLIELIFVLSNSVLIKTTAVCIGKYQTDWTPLNEPHNNRISYGHDLENIWLVKETCDAVGISNYLLLDFYRTLFLYSLRYGFDYKKGGFYNSGPINASSDKKEKIWWVQAEALVSALTMYQLTGEQLYANCFFSTLDWIVRYQVDWENGDWHAKITEKGKPSGDKADAWKSPYHNGRASIRCLELLNSTINKDKVTVR